jgi:UDP-N-acetylmuramoyl-L-alanyl-D-glutamate--2,6-diaminopimelate ligase
MVKYKHMKITGFIKKLIPKKLINSRHLFWAWYGAFKYKNPSDELMVIGITGTSGKSSVIHFLRQVLEHAGYKVGSLSTVDFYIGGEEKLNDQKMTMLGKMQIQKYLRKMVDKKCDIAIVETTSEGRLQYRHSFINYDMMLLTNLYPEHIDSHGSFENYKQAKLDIFKHLSKSKVKNNGKIAIVNGGSEHADEFLQYKFDQKIKFNTKNKDTKVTKEGLHFETHGYHFNAPLFGLHNIENLLAVVTIARALDIAWQDIQEAIKKIKSAPGRIEFIYETEKFGFQTIVDYAFEPKAMGALYEVVDLLKPKRIIHVFGSTGGGRDKERRFTLGKMIGEKAHVCIVTDEDPYDDDPMEIINDVASAVEKTGKKLDKNLFKVLDRKEAIVQSIEMAEEGDLILVTGKGSEQGMCVAGGKMIEWDDRKIVRDSLQNKKLD